MRIHAHCALARKRFFLKTCYYLLLSLTPRTEAVEISVDLPNGHDCARPRYCLSASINCLRCRWTTFGSRLRPPGCHLEKLAGARSGLGRYTTGCRLNLPSTAISEGRRLIGYLCLSAALDRDVDAAILMRIAGLRLELDAD